MRKNIKNFKRLCTLLIMSLLIGSAPGSVTHGASKLKLYSYETKKVSEYSDKQITYVYNDKTISLNNMPGLLSSNGVALGSYTHIFQQTLGLSCSLNKSSKNLTILNGSTKIVMTVGSRTAYVNGKAVTMNAAPVTYKYMNTNKAITLVPTRFVAEALGYRYNWNSSTSTVTITKPLNLNYDNKNSTYTGSIGKVTVDDKIINVTTLPAIILSNTAMVQAWKVFTQGMGVNYKINNSTGDITFTKGKITVGMKLNSTLATINGEIVDCGVAPRYVKNLDNNTEVVMVPVQFLSKALGYDYSWNDVSKEANIKTTSLVGEKSQITPVPSATPAPTNLPSITVTPTPGDTGNSGSIPVEEMNYFTWNTNDLYLQEVELAKQSFANFSKDKLITTDNQNITSINNISLESRDSNVLSETFTISLVTAPSSITATQLDNTITLTLNNTITSDMTYNLSSALVTNVSTVMNNNDTSSKVNFQLTDSTVYYDMKLSEDGSSISITIYPNYITKITGGREALGNGFVSLSAIKDLNAEVTADDYYVYVSVPNAANVIGDLQYAANTEQGISFVLLEKASKHSTQLVIQKPSVGATYHVTNDKNNLFISFGKEVDSSVDEKTLEILLPSGVTESNITDDDQYYNKQIVLSMMGDYTNFYKSNPIITGHAQVSSASVKYEGGETKIIIKTKKIQGYSLNYSSNALNLTIDNPSAIYSKIVVLDAGHGGVDPGTSHGTIKEKDIVFNILNNYAKDYFAGTDIKFYYSRTNDTKIDLYKRAGFSAEVEADLFVSLHVNSSTNTTAKGTNVYYTADNKAQTKGGLNSEKLSRLLVNNLSTTLGTNNRGIVKGNFVVISKNTVPAVLIELAFLSNASDRALLTNTSVQKKAAKTIIDTIDTALNMYPTGR